VDNNFTAEYTYNESGIRTRKVVNGITTDYVLEGGKVILETTGSDELHYSYDSRGQLVSFKLNGTPYFYTRNGQGDITGLIDASGVEVVRYTYDSWGKPVSITDTSSTGVGAKNPYRYRGYRYDHESGLYYLQSRYYDPSIKRFISADIFVSTGQGFSGNNVYAYCGNQPINRSDSGGMFWETAFDVVSLGFSIWEVVQNPKDPWAWAGLVGDAIDLLPIVTGVGETTRAIKAANKVVETADNAVDAIKGGSKTVFNSIDEGLNFAKTPAGHMENPGRFVPVQTLQDAIRSTKGLADPKGSEALMHYTEMFKNGKQYNLEVLYGKATNTVYHFKYTQEAIGPLKAIK
jgi:RHS repeat-associated protein